MEENKGKLMIKRGDVVKRKQVKANCKNKYKKRGNIYAMENYL